MKKLIKSVGTVVSEVVSVFVEEEHTDAPEMKLKSRAPMLGIGI